MTHTEEMLKPVIESLGGRFVAIKPDDQKEGTRRIREVQLALPQPSHLRTLRQELGSSPTPQTRYEIEYQNGLYQSYKPGIDDIGLENLLGIGLTEIGTCLEIGGGPAYICELVKKANHLVNVWSIDLAPHPRLKTIGAQYLFGDITSAETASQCRSLIPKQGKVLLILSYCLDRVSDQRNAIRHFGSLLQTTRGRGVGLITVCLPAIPSSSGVSGLEYKKGEWITYGRDHLEDYSLIVNACKGERLNFIRGGFTLHYGISLDGFETIPCYCMVLE